MFFTPGFEYISSIFLPFRSRCSIAPNSFLDIEEYSSNDCLTNTLKFGCDSIGFLYVSLIHCLYNARTGYYKMANKPYFFVKIDVEFCFLKQFNRENINKFISSRLTNSPSLWSPLNFFGRTAIVYWGIQMMLLVVVRTRNILH